jgi:hypothetical protein
MVRFNLVALLELDALVNHDLGGNHRGSFYSFPGLPPAEQTELNSCEIFVAESLLEEYHSERALATTARQRLRPRFFCASLHRLFDVTG